MKKTFLPFLLVLIIFAACSKTDYNIDPTSATAASKYSGKFVRDYYTLLCRVSQTTPGFFPPEVSRAYGYVGMVNYEVVVNGIDQRYSLAGQVSGLWNSSLPHPVAHIEYNWAIASNAAIADMMKRMFEKRITSANISSIDSAEQVNLATMSVSVKPDVVARSIQFGKDMSEAIFQYSLTDGGHEAYVEPFQLPYTMPPDPACWVPTGALLNPISPKWGNNRPFIQANVVGTQQYTPVTFSTDAASAFYQQAMATYNQVKSNTPEQTTITKYWADDPFNTCTPTGHTFNIMTQLLEETGATLEKTSVAYAKLSIAEMDAFISCWKAKYTFILIRPVSYIKKYIDPNFTTVIGTPAFPAFTSGHSCEIGAGTKIFTDMFTDGSGNYNFTDMSQLRYGFAPRTYNNFDAMAEECAKSRFYGGIHYPMDNERGLDVGRAIGDNVNRLIRWPSNIK